LVCRARRLAQPFCDAWCEELKVAAEFQGVQHARYPNPAHKSRTAFEAQVKRDTLKQMLCQERGICLILVPHTVTSEQMASFLREALDQSKHETSVLATARARAVRLQQTLTLSSSAAYARGIDATLSRVSHTAYDDFQRFYMNVCYVNERKRLAVQFGAGRT